MIQNCGTLFNGCEKGVDVTHIVSMDWNRQQRVIFLQEQT